MKSLLLHIKQFISLNILNRCKKSLSYDVEHEGIVIKYFKLKDKGYSKIDIFEKMSKKYDHDNVVYWLGKSESEKNDDYDKIKSEQLKIYHENRKYKSPD